MAFPNLYKRSIFFEILSLNEAGEPQTILESLALTIPPSSIDIVQTQRVTTTPTPGGFFVDNYGLGSAKITITGDTGNYEDRLTILGPGKTPRRLTGQEVYFEFRDRIARYSLNNENYTMRFYDLTHKGNINIFQPVGTNTISRYSEAWEVVLDESALRRSSAKPLFYPYSISLTGIRPLGTFNPRLSDTALGFISDIRALIDTVTIAVASFESDMQAFVDQNLEYISEVTGIFTSVTAFATQLTSFTDSIIEYEQKLGGLFGEVLSETEATLTAGFQIISFPYDTLETARQQLEDVRDQTESLLETAVTDGKNVLDKYDWDVDSDPVSEISQNTTAIEEPFNTIMLTAKQDSSYEPIGAVAVNGVVTPIYGFTPFVVQENTRLDKIARDVYGDPDLKDIISGINGIYSNDELVPATIIKIPILQPNVRYANNSVYNIPDERDDVIGRDADVNESGVFVLNANDYSFVSNDDNMRQTVGFKLAEKRGRQIRDGSYGIVTQIGEALNDEAPFEFLSVSLSETLVQDPRITSVYDLNFLADGDKIYQEFKFDTITRPAVTYKEGI